MKWSLEKKIIAAGFGLAMLILGMASAISYRNTARLFERQKQVEHSYQVLQDIRDVLTTLRDAERARRGYIITGKESYLKIYHTALQEIDVKFNRARRSTADNAPQQRRLDAIAPLIAQRVALIERSVELYKQNKFDMTEQIELTDRGLILHDEVWKIITKMETEERLLLQRRATESLTSFRYTLLMDIIGSCFSFGLLFGVYWLLIKQIRKQKIAQEELRNSEERFRQIAGNIQEIFWMSDIKSNKFLYINPAYEQIWGCSCESLYSNPKSFLDSVHPEDREIAIANLEHNTIKEREIEYRIIRSDGSIRWVWERSFPIKNAAGEVYRRAGVTQDITERKRVEEVRRSLEKERELSELKLRFFSMASHEFRTPLSTILVSAQLLENSSKKWPEEKKIKNLRRIQDSAKTMTQLLTDILTLTRAEAGKLEFNPENLDLEEFCHSIIEEIEISDRVNQNIFFISQCRQKQAFMDEKLLRSIFTNLLVNAIKYSPEDSHIYFILSHESENAIFQIQDRGIGISPEDQQNLYQSFYRCSNVGDVPGTGLGLAVVKKCVELHGGSITVESKVGIGTTFTVTIPWQII